MSGLIWSERLETKLCNFICPAGRPRSIISTSDMPSIYIQGSKKGFFKEYSQSSSPNVQFKDWKTILIFLVFYCSKVK